MRPSIIGIALLLNTSAALLTGQESERSLIDPVEHRADIRAALLKQTPLGTTISGVQKVIRANFAQTDADVPPVESHGAEGEAAVKSPNRGVKSLRLVLAAYIENPGTIFLSAPLVNEKQVVAQWAFDENGRLVEIFVDKTTRTY